MNLLHSPEGRTENVFRLFPGHGSGLFQTAFQSFSLYKVHDNIGRVVFPEQVPNPDNTGNIVHPGHFPGFFQEHFQPILPGPLGLFAAVPSQCSSPRAAVDLTGGVILLNGHLPFQRNIPADVGNTKAALTQHFPHQIFSR